MFYFADTVFISEKRLVKTLPRCVTDVAGWLKDVKAWFRFDAGSPKVEKSCLVIDAAWHRNAAAKVATTDPLQRQEKRRTRLRKKGCRKPVNRTGLSHPKVPDRL